VTAYIFAGPTISAAEVRREIDAVVLPPAGHGDVYLAALQRPQAIGIVDGIFERVPAVWHKEILWAMSEGVHVFGAASMGALRAAELAAFGMEGVGAIFESFRDGTLEDDDEVAVVHGAADEGYRPFSEAMVNIRATLRSAERARAVSPTTGARLERLAKHLFYPQRTYSALLRLGAAEGVPRAQLERFQAWLVGGQRDQKREDALALIATMRDFLAAGPGPNQVRYFFEHTEAWDHAVGLGSELSQRQTPDDGHAPFADIVAELALEPNFYGATHTRALFRLLACEQVRQRGVTITSAELELAFEQFRRTQGLVAPQELDRWLTENDLEWDSFLPVLQDEVRVRWAEAVSKPYVAKELRTILRLEGQYPRLSARAAEKTRVLRAHGLDAPTLHDAGVTEQQLLDWYFERRLGRRVPKDLERYAQSVGFGDVDELRRTLVREFCFVNIVPRDRHALGHGARDSPERQTPLAEK
jgi:hypothetical protein